MDSHIWAIADALLRAEESYKKIINLLILLFLIGTFLDKAT
jgi:hypothetical protein